MSRIIAPTDPIVIKRIRVLIYGQPGLGKTSTAFTANKPLLLDFDKGAHRSRQRKHIKEINAWSDVVEMMQNGASELAPFETIVVDTTGRCLDVIGAHLIASNYKLGNKNGALSLQGWGELKGVFASWMKQLTLLDKDVVLIAHDKEEKDGDVKTVRPDVQGGSYGEVMKVVDFAGYLYKNNNERTLDFNPTDKWVGKNAADFSPLVIPDFTSEPDWFSVILQKMKDAMSSNAITSASVENVVTEWEDTIMGFTSADDFNKVFPQLSTLNKAVLTQVASVLRKRREELGIAFDKDTKTFSDAKPVVKPSKSNAPVEMEF